MGWFFTETVSLPGKTVDAKRDFGAKGDGKADDTQAVQATIDAAREHGNRALAYFPAGTYNITRTLQVHGRNYSLGGAGLETTLRWRGPLVPSVMEVKDPQAIAIEHLTIASDNDGARVRRGTTESGKKTSVAEFFKSKTAEDRIRENTGNVKIRQTGEAKQSSIHYNGLYLTSTYDAVPGIEFVNLPPGTEVRIGALYGCLHFSDSAQATALASVHYGRLVVDGAKLPKSGFIGMLFHNDVHRDFALTVKDNQDLVVADFYQEQNERHVLLEGGERAGKGHVTIGSSKIASVEPGFVTIRDYEGRVWISGGSVHYPTPGAAYQTNPVFLAHTGKRPLDFILAATHFFQRGTGEPDPVFNFAESVRFASIENSCGGGQGIHPLPNRVPEGSLQVAAEALDDFREIGRINLRLNYPNNLKAAK
ncbi:MAG: hypothetical protein FJ276_19195 [Planctomycetes bacterium]|nr:hypothetical protein [Planctomycetota bacterium]